VEKEAFVCPLFSILVLVLELLSSLYCSCAKAAAFPTTVKRRSTWAITPKTSPMTPNDTPWSTDGQGLVKTLVKPLEHPIALQCQPKLLPRSPNFT
jgi:hypothetical protein